MLLEQVAAANVATTFVGAERTKSSVHLGLESFTTLLRKLSLRVTHALQVQTLRSWAPGDNLVKPPGPTCFLPFEAIFDALIRIRRPAFISCVGDIFIFTHRLICPKGQSSTNYMLTNLHSFILNPQYHKIMLDGVYITFYRF